MKSEYTNIKLKQGIVYEIIYKNDPESEDNVSELINSIYTHTDIKLPICTFYKLEVNPEYTAKDLIKEYIAMINDMSEMIFIVNAMSYGIGHDGMINDMVGSFTDNLKDLLSMKFSNIIWSTSMGNSAAKLISYAIYRNKEGTKFIKDCTKNGLIYQEIKKM